MIERVALLILLAAAAVALYRGFNWWAVRRTAALAPGDPLLAQRQPGVPSIVYFTTPLCAPCRTQQRPTLHRLMGEWADVQIIEVDASEQPDAAARWGVLSVPTTFILDRDGRTRQINRGVADLDKLKTQLQGL